MMRYRRPEARALQRSSVEQTFAPRTRTTRQAPPRAVAEELVPAPGGAFQVRGADVKHSRRRAVRSISSASRGDAGVFAALRQFRHATRADRGWAARALRRHRPFERGQMAWWSNYSGTYQPIAAFRAQAGLPEDKFVPGRSCSSAASPCSAGRSASGGRPWPNGRPQQLPPYRPARPTPPQPKGPHS